MSGRESPPQLGSALLAAASASLAALRAHLTDPDPKVSLRASAELTKLLGVCARHGIALAEAAEPTGIPPTRLPSPPAPVGDLPRNGGGGASGIPPQVTEREQRPTSPLAGLAGEVAEVSAANPAGGGNRPPDRSTLPAANRRRRRTPFHESHARADRPPTEIARPPSAIPA